MCSYVVKGRPLGSERVVEDFRNRMWFVVVTMILIGLAVALPGVLSRLVSSLWLNAGNTLVLHTLLGRCASEDRMDFLGLPARTGCESDMVAERTFIKARAADSALWRLYRGMAFAQIARGDLPGAAMSLETYLAHNRDDTGRLLLANLYHLLNRPVEALAIYEEFSLQVDDPLQVNRRALERRIVVEQIRAGVLLMENGHYEEAYSNLEAALSAEPGNLVGLYYLSRLEEAKGQLVNPARQMLETCQFKIPTDPALLDMLPVIADDLVARGVWPEEMKVVLREFAAWRNATIELGVPVIYDEHGFIDRRGLKLPGNLLTNPMLRSEPVRGHPWLWQWQEWIGGDYQTGVFYGGVERVDGPALLALRVSGVCTTHETDKHTTHAGFSPEWVRVIPGHRYRLSFAYRTQPGELTSGGVYYLWAGKDSQEVHAW